MARHGQAKLANFHFGLGLQRELEHAGAGTASLISHPGLSNTDLQAVSVQQTGGGASQRFFLALALALAPCEYRDIQRCRSRLAPAAGLDDGMPEL
jgi:hypothetical protein